MDNRLKALVVMQMRYKVPRNLAAELGEAWLMDNPGQTWSTLHELLKMSQVEVVNNQLVYIGQNAAQNTSPSPPQVQTPQQSSSPNPQKPQRLYRGKPL